MHRTAFGSSFGRPAPLFGKLDRYVDSDHKLARLGRLTNLEVKPTGQPGRHRVTDRSGAWPGELTITETDAAYQIESTQPAFRIEYTKAGQATITEGHTTRRLLNSDLGAANNFLINALRPGT